MLSKAFVALSAFIMAAAAQDYYQSYVDSSLCLTAESLDNGAAVTVETCDNSSQQAWTFQNGALTINNGAKCLDVVDGNTAAGAPVQVWDCTAGDANQLWYYESDMIRWTYQGRCLDLTNGSATPGNQLTTAICAGSYRDANQEWTAVPADSS